MTYDLGIDVGTSYTACAVRRPDGQVANGQVSVVGLGPIVDSIPTVLFRALDGTTLVGDAANRRSLIDPDGAAREFKRRLGDPNPITLSGVDYSAVELIGAMLAYVVSHVAELNGSSARHVTVTHPANWGPDKHELFDQALKLAGLEKASKLAEPTAAALAYAAEARVPIGTTVAVYDLGGGTFDAAILEKTVDDFNVLGETVGIDRLGGVDVDEMILDYLKSEVGDDWPTDDDPRAIAPLLHVRRACMEAKELLSTERRVSIPVLLPGVDVDVHLTRAHLETLIAPAIARSAEALQKAIGTADIADTDIDTILLVGGTSRIPLVRKSLERRFKCPIGTDVDPLFAVVRGAAIAAGVRGDQAAPTTVEPPASATETTARTAGLPSAYAATQPGLGIATSQRPAAEASASSGTNLPVTGQGGNPTRHHEPNQKPAGANPHLGDAPSGGHRLMIGLISGGVLTALLIIGMVGLLANVLGDDDSQPVEVTVESDVVVAAPADAENSDPVETVGVPSAQRTVAIPSGHYTIGAAEPRPKTQSPAMTVDVESFHIDAFEVSNAEYKTFFDQQRAPAPWGEGGFPEDRDTHPVVGVTYDWADAYCRSSSKRLPTEIEWEVAAGGLAASPFPWGDERNAITLPTTDTYPVGSETGNVSTFGAYDLSGNAWEWVSSPYDEAIAADQRVLRGGQPGFVLRTNDRLIVDPADPRAAVGAGFRCAADKVDPSINNQVFGAFQRPITTLPKDGTEAGSNRRSIQDDFTDPRSGWPTVASDEQRYGYNPDGFYEVESRNVIGDTMVEAPVNAISQNITVRATLTLNVETTSTDGEARFGLAFRWDDEGGGLFFVVNPATSEFSVGERTPAGFTNVTTGPATLPTDAPVELEMRPGEADVNMTNFLVNGQVVHSEQFPGRIGARNGVVTINPGMAVTAVRVQSYELG